jgi:hypothetical protein
VRAGRCNPSRLLDPARPNTVGATRPHGAVLTLDAMHNQTDTATPITGAGGDYVFTVKADMTQTPPELSRSH